MLNLSRKTLFVGLAIVVFPASIINAHGIGPRGIQPLDWHTDQISQVTAFLPFSVPGVARTEKVEGKNCMIANVLDFNVLDDYAYDIDETVEVEIEFDLEKSGSAVMFQYDKNGDISAKEEITLPDLKDSRWYRHTFTLERARFAGRRIIGFSHHFTSGDFSVGVPRATEGEYVSVCGITLKRSYTTPQIVTYGRLALKLVDEAGSRVSARVGIYDASSRMPLPDQEALPVRYFSDITRTVTVPPGRVSWPAKNHYAFYVDGNYNASLPVGTYDLVVARGLEYRILQKSFEIAADKETLLNIELQRWTDMSAKGWYSGDVHVHYGRANAQDSFDIRRHVQAEDLNVANLLQMGNIGTIAYSQYNWGEEAHYGEAPYILVPGQEDPRTTRHGHTIQLNIDAPIRNPERYYLYHEVFEAVHQQGGMTGYAHTVRPEYPGMRSGMALDVPFNLVDFFEVLQFGTAGTEAWFDFLNLGYKLSPAAGTDYPYLDLPGAVRNYVDIGKMYSAQEWFDGLKDGRTFVTNGPMLELTVNGKGIGSDVRVKKGDTLTIEARATINPDIDQLDRIELIQQGEVIATTSSEEGAAELQLIHEVPADHGGWFVLKAQGKQEKQYENVVALSAPVYIYVDGNGFCKPSAIPSIVSEQKGYLIEMSLSPDDAQAEFEAWDTWGPQERYWPANKALLQKRIDQVNIKYDELVALANKGQCIVN